MEENRDFRRPQSLSYHASNHIKLGMHIFTPVTVIFQKRLKIEESIRQKMGAEQRQLDRYEQRCKIQHI